MMAKLNNLFSNKHFKRAYVATLVLIVLGIGVAAYVEHFVLKKPAPVKYTPYSQQLNDLLKQTAPQDPMQQAVYYSQLGQYYDEAGDHDHALTSYLQAQSVIEKNNLQDMIVFYEAIANVYKEKGDTKNEKTYLEKYRDYLVAYQKAHPDNPGAGDSLTDVQKRLATL